MEQFAAYPDIQNCMSKMLLHHYCAVRAPVGLRRAGGGFLKELGPQEGGPASSGLTWYHPLWLQARLQISDTMLQEAIRRSVRCGFLRCCRLTATDGRVHRMAFVGLTEAYNASVCLLYHMYEVRIRLWVGACTFRSFGPCLIWRF